MAWVDAWGTYSRKGNYHDVAMIGSPKSTYLGLPMAKAHAEGLGRGIQFTALNDAGTNVKLELSLVGISAEAQSGEPRASSINYTGYVDPYGGTTRAGFTYGWLLDIYVSTDGGITYSKKISNEVLAKHSTPMGLAYTENLPQTWRSAIIEKTFTLTDLPSNFTHIKVEVKGDAPAVRHQNIYGREIVIPPEVKPWAIRKSGSFKTLNRLSGNFNRRISGTWHNKSSQLESSVGKKDLGVARIRKSSSWVGQNKIGDM